MTNFTEEKSEAASAMELNLNILDPETISALSSKEEGREREEYALAALKLGIQAFNLAGGQLDRTALEKTGELVIEGLETTFKDREAALLQGLKAQFDQHLDPETGSLGKTIGDFFGETGELRRMLEGNLGSEGSTLTKTLALHVGSDSPIFKMLSPDDTNSIKAQLEKAMEAALLEQRKQILTQFTLDDENSALARLVKKVEASNQSMGTELDAGVKKVVSEFSLDSESSALSRLKGELKKQIEDIAKQNKDFHLDIENAIASLTAGRKAAEKGTEHGHIFEENVGVWLTERGTGLGHSVEPTGNKVGLIKNNKKGDFVLTMGQESPSPGAKIVWEAKEDASYTTQSAQNESIEARKNRGAQIGIFVFSKKAAPVGMPPVSRNGEDILLVWDAELADGELVLEAGLSIAQALLLREGATGTDIKEALKEIEKAVLNIEKEAGKLDQMKTKAETIKSNAEYFLKQLPLMQTQIEKEIGVLNGKVSDLRAE